MASPIARTFHFLNHTANQSATSLLIATLNSGYAEIAQMAAEALATSKSSSSHLELINLYDQLEESCKEKVNLNASYMNYVMEDILKRGQTEKKLIVLEIIQKGRDYKIIKGLLKALAVAKDQEESGKMVECISDLTDSLYEQYLEEKTAHSPKYAEFISMMHEFMNEIEHAVHDVNLQQFQSRLIEFVLILGSPPDIAVDRLVKSTQKNIREHAEEILLTSHHPGTMSLVSEYMSWKMPHKSALKAMEKRTDPEFVFALLRGFPDDLTDLDRKNYGQLSNVSWITKRESLIELMSPDLQVAMVRFVSVLGIPDSFKTNIFQWVISNCCAEACQEASGVLDMLQSEEVFSMINQGLDSENEGVQAWAVTQLREQHVPDAMKLLMERLDSPVEKVREAARKELEGFNIDLIMQIQDKLKPEVCRNIGVLIRKTDPQYREKLSGYLHSAIVSQRIRALQAIRKLGLYRDLLQELLTLSEDPDMQVKRTLADLLSLIPDAEVVEVLNKMTSDESNKVKKASLEAIRELAGRDWLIERL